jgi:hypothetical protein
MNKTTNVMASSLLFVATLCSAQTSYENSPYNYKNSPYNYENSQYNYKNSPYNYSNSPVNPYAPNAVFDAQGNRIGYKTESNQKTTNYYSNDGTRRGYSRK